MSRAGLWAPGPVPTNFSPDAVSAFAGATAASTLPSATAPQDGAIGHRTPDAVTACRRLSNIFAASPLLCARQDAHRPTSAPVRA